MSLATAYLRSFGHSPARCATPTAAFRSSVRESLCIGTFQRKVPDQADSSGTLRRDVSNSALQAVFCVRFGREQNKIQWCRRAHSSISLLTDTSRRFTAVTISAGSGFLGSFRVGTAAGVSACVAMLILCLPALHLRRIVSHRARSLIFNIIGNGSVQGVVGLLLVKRFMHHRQSIIAWSSIPDPSELQIPMKRLWKASQWW